MCVCVGGGGGGKGYVGSPLKLLGGGTPLPTPMHLCQHRIYFAELMHVCFEGYC